MKNMGKNTNRKRAEERYEEEGGEEEEEEEEEENEEEEELPHFSISRVHVENQTSFLRLPSP
jgi:hypothetical protein